MWYLPLFEWPVDLPTHSHFGSGISSAFFLLPLARELLRYLFSIDAVFLFQFSLPYLTSRFGYILITHGFSCSDYQSAF